MSALFTYTAFEKNELFFRGTLSEVVLKTKKKLGKDEHNSILIFSDATGKIIDFNFQGTEKDVQKRLEVYVSETVQKDYSGPGRPKLGVMSREVSLLPGHWEWLATQSDGASATLRKLVDEAKKKTASGNQVKQAQEKTYKFMSAMAGDFNNYEEALRALYKKDKKNFLLLMHNWPNDIKNHIEEISFFVFN